MCDMTRVSRNGNRIASHVKHKIQCVSKYWNQGAASFGHTSNVTVPTLTHVRITDNSKTQGLPLSNHVGNNAPCQEEHQRTTPF